MVFEFVFKPKVKPAHIDWKPILIPRQLSKKKKSFHQAENDRTGCFYVFKNRAYIALISTAPKYELTILKENILHATTTITA